MLEGSRKTVWELASPLKSFSSKFLWLLPLGLIGVAELFQPVNPEKVQNDPMRALYLNVQVVSKSGTHQESILYAFPHRWLIARELVPGCRELAVCDSHTAWVINQNGAQMQKVRKWDIDKLLKSYSEEDVFENLRIEAFSGIVTIAMPTNRDWAREFNSKAWQREAKCVGNSTLGAIATIVYESKEPPIVQMSFGKEDGILRQQIQYDRSKKEAIKYTTKAIIRNPDFSPTMFNFKPGNDAEVIDKTKELAEEIAKRE